MSSFNVQANAGTQVAVTNAEELNFITGKGTTPTVVNQTNPTVQINLTALTSNWDAGGYEIRSRTFESDVPTGTAPLTIASTTQVNNLNAAYLNGRSHADFISSTVDDQKTGGTLTFNDNTKIGFGTSNGEGTLYSNGTATYWDMVADKDLIIRDVTTSRFTFDVSAGYLTAARFVGAATKAIVTHSTSSTYFPVVWHNNSSVLYDTNTNFTFQASTGTLKAADFVLNSDRRKKKNITDYKIEKLNTNFKSFYYRNQDGGIRFGVIAQELQIENPELVREDQDGYLSVSYTGLLIREVAYLKQENDKKEEKINDLEERLSRLEKIVFQKI